MSQTSVDLVLETRGAEHTAQLHRDLGGSRLRGRRGLTVQLVAAPSDG